MKARALILFLLTLPIIGFSQNQILKGKVVDYKTLQPMTYTQVLFDSTFQSIANEKGEFEIEANEKVITDTLKIRFIGCFDINIINIPNYLDTVDLGIIPIFEYFPGNDMTHFNCKEKDLECKEKEKKHIEKENKRIEEYFAKVNNAIEYFDYRFQNKTYKIDLKTGCIDLSSEN